MTNLLILMLLYLTYAAISFWLFNYNFLSPSFVFLSSLSAMLCIAYYAAVNMDMLFAINIRTFAIFAWAGFIFLATEFFVYAGHTVNYFQNNKHVIPKEPEPLIINPQIQRAAVIFLVFSLMLAVVVLYINTGGGSWGDRMRAYRAMFMTNASQIRFFVITSQLYKINIVIADFFGYVLVYNFTACNVPLREMRNYIICVLLFAAYSVLYTAARQSAIELFLFMLMIYTVLNSRPGRKAKIIGLIMKSIPALLLIASIFTILGPLIGRYETTKSSLQNFVEYFCGGLYAFNLRIDLGASTKIWGQSSFSILYQIPKHFGFMQDFQNEQLFAEFHMYGNTVSIFGRWYLDFGATGVFIMTFLVSLLYSLSFYRKIVHSQNISSEHHLARIYYCQFMTALVWAGYDDRINALLTLQTLVFLILTAILYKMLVVEKFKLF